MAVNDPKDGAPPTSIHISEKKTNWLAWIALALGLLALLFALSRCNRKDEVATVTNTTETVTTENTMAGNSVGTTTPAAPVEKVTLPGGKTVDLAPQTLNYELQKFLSSNEAAPRTFTFDKLNFDTAKADIRADDQGTLNALGQILTAYPKAKVALVGYTDARGGAGANDKLGEQRAMAVAEALKKAGIAADRITTKSGGETNPTDTNATAKGQFDNRRTELTVTSK